MRWFRHIGAILSAVCVAVAAGSAAAQEASGDCMLVESKPEKATITVRSSFASSAAAPATFCSLKLQEDYMLTAWAPGYERRSIKFRIEEFGAPVNFDGRRMGSITRSVFLPGWGQKSLGKGSTSIMEHTTFVVVGGFKVLQSYRWYDEARDKYEYFHDLANTATEQEIIERSAEASRRYAMTANVYRDNTIFTAAAAGWAYADNLFETYLLAAPPRRTRLGGSNFKVEIPRRSKLRSFYRSLFFPGMGQKYNGNVFRAVFFKSAFYLLAFFSVDAKMRYDLAVVDYTLARDALRTGESAAALDALSADASLKYQAVEDREREMYTFAIATGAVWLVNLIDAYASGGKAVPPNRFDVQTGMNSSSFRTGVVMRF